MFVSMLLSILLFNETAVNNDTSDQAGEGYPALRMYYYPHHILQDFKYYDIPGADKSESEIVGGFFREFRTYLSDLEYYVHEVDETNRVKVKDYSLHLAAMWFDLIPQIANRLESFPEHHVAFAQTTELLFGCGANLLERAGNYDIAVEFESFLVELHEGMPDQAAQFLNVLGAQLDGGFYSEMVTNAEMFLSNHYFLGNNMLTRSSYLNVIDYAVAGCEMDGDPSGAELLRTMRAQISSQPVFSSMGMSEETANEILVANFYDLLVNPLRNP